MNASPLLEMSRIAKSFGATAALRGVSFSVCPGEARALIGENGAGKSTLMKVLSGAHAPDAGEMRISGQVYNPRGPFDARRAGEAMIYQELNLAPDLSVEDNILLGMERRRYGLLDRASQRANVRRTLQVLGHPDLSPGALVRNLSVGTQQLVEIARALVLSARLIVFDEPTSSLTQRDADHLFRVIRSLKAAGIGIVYISHFLEEIRGVCDSYTVLRDGADVGHGNLATVSQEQIVALMVGRNVEDLFPRSQRQPGATLLDVSSLTGVNSPRDVAFSVRRGEILGIAGLIGAGRTELLRAIFALDPVVRGKVRVSGDISLPTTPARIRSGLGMVSEDRKREGLAQSLSVTDNLTLSRLGPYRRWGWLDRAARRRGAARWMRKLQIKAASPSQEIHRLSGGNQQKVAIARVLHQEADILLLDEPTRGIDVGTKAEIYRLMDELATQGRAVVFVSSYLPELLAVCDRIGVMARGRLREIRPASEWSEHQIMSVAVATDGQGDNASASGRAIGATARDDLSGRVSQGGDA